LADRRSHRVLWYHKTVKHEEQLVDLVNEAGIVVGVKKRRDIQKRKDLYHTVFTIFITPDRKILLSKIPVRRDFPTIYPGLLGATVATIKRHGESASEASIRSVQSELYLENSAPLKIGEGYRLLLDGHRKYMSVYCTLHPEPETFSKRDIDTLHSFTHEELARELKAHPELFAPTFLAIWDSYGEQLSSALARDALDFPE
jgi:isopentenyldiphosphate isomerase